MHYPSGEEVVVNLYKLPILTMNIEQPAQTPFLPLHNLFIYLMFFNRTN